MAVSARLTQSRKERIHTVSPSCSDRPMNRSISRKSRNGKTTLESCWRYGTAFSKRCTCRRFAVVEPETRARNIGIDAQLVDRTARDVDFDGRIGRRIDRQVQRPLPPHRDSMSLGSSTRPAPTRAINRQFTGRTGPPSRDVQHLGIVSTMCDAPTSGLLQQDMLDRRARRGFP